MMLSMPGAALRLLRAAVVLLAAASVPAYASERVANLEVIDRTDGRALTILYKYGQAWVEGTPGHEYLLRVRNRGGGRVLAVTSVDGVSVVTGETAAPSQSGYVLDAFG